MKIYLDADQVLHVEDRIYKKGIDLVFCSYETTKFDIRIAGTDNTILGKIYDIAEEAVTDSANSAYANVPAIYTAIKSIFVAGMTGIPKGQYSPILSNTVDLTHPGWLEATVAGTVKYDTFYGETITRTVDVGWVSLGIVSRVWLIGTSATIVVHYE